MPSINDRAMVAADPSTATTRLHELASDKSSKVREAVAKNPSTPTDILSVLVRDAERGVRFAVGENPSLRAREVAFGASDPDTRGRAAQWGDLDGASIQRVLNDPVHSVRMHLAASTKDSSIAAALARDPHPAVRATVVQNQTLSDDDVEMLAQDRLAQVRVSAAGSRSVRPETLTRMAEDRSAQVRWSVLIHNPERLDLARKIAEDPDEMNATQAKEQLEHPRTFTAAFGEIELIT